MTKLQADLINAIFEGSPQTTRLTIQYGDQNIGADIEPGVSLLDALKEITKGLEQVNRGDFEEIDMEEFDE